MKLSAALCAIALCACEGRAPQPPPPAPVEAPGPCDDLRLPPPLGIVDAIVDEQGAARALAHRRARHEERLRHEVSPAADRLRLEQRHITAGCVDLDGIVDVGRGLFVRRASAAEGFGHAGADGPAGLRRVQRGRFGGPDALACVDCHWKGGDAGAGDRADNAYILGDGDDVGSADARNPPALFGAGWVELAAAQLTRALHTQRDALISEARVRGAAVDRQLVVGGIGFGLLRAKPGDGGVELDTSGVEGVDADLVIKPFGHKGTVRDLRTFIGRALQQHHGLQAEELVDAARAGEDVGVDLTRDGARVTGDDPDGDGVDREVTAGQLTALVLFLATLDAPPHRPLEEAPVLESVLFSNELEFVRSPEFTARFASGYALFGRVGCASCHVPFVRVSDPRYQTRTSAGEVVTVDLGTDGAQPAPARDQAGDYLLPVFSDFKRHDLGPDNAFRHSEDGVASSVWLTRRLWASSQTSPYMHDGAASTIDEALARHGGEATTAARNFSLLSERAKVDLRLFLATLTRAPALRVR